MSLRLPSLPFITTLPPPPPCGATVVSSKWLFHRPLGLMLFIMLMASSSSSFWLFHHKHHLSLAPQCYLNAAHIKGRKLSVAKARGLLFARWNLCCLCTFITSSPSPSLFSVLIFLYPFLLPLSVFPSFLDQSVGALPPSLTWSAARAVVGATLSMLPLPPPRLYSPASTFQRRIIPSAWSSFLPL